MLVRLRAASIVAFALFLAVTPAFPWGFTGHRIIALIAEQRLSPEVRAKIDQLLLDGKYSIVDISVCADVVRPGPSRGTPRPEEAMCKALAGVVPDNSGSWHYINIPLPPHSQTLDAFCPGGNCAVEKIKTFSDILRTSTDDEQRRAALLFLVHLVGDLHQPLHAVDRACDHGGNSEHVNFTLDAKTLPNENLHRVWDTDELDLLMNDSKITNEREFAVSLNSQIHPGQAAKWARATPEQIAWESYRLAKTKVYRRIPFQNFCEGRKPPPIVTDLPLFYEKDGERVVRAQLMKAGVRLAAILEADLGPQ